jgi:CBS domain-containing protein
MSDTGIIHSALREPIAYLSGSVWSPPQASNARLRHELSPERPVALTDRALHVVTDFTWERPLTIPEDRPIDEALQLMILAQVRALLVVQHEVVTGLITSYDIQGERPLQFLQRSGYTPHDEIAVGHIMTPWKRVPTLDWQAVHEAHVSDLVRVFKSSDATHVVITEHSDQGAVFACGLISRCRLRRQLGHSIDIDP